MGCDAGKVGFLGGLGLVFDVQGSMFKVRCSKFKVSTLSS